VLDSGDERTLPPAFFLEQPEHDTDHRRHGF
jgi:hypothetical protein